MNRLVGVALLPCVVLLLAGCGGGGGSAALPDGGGQAFRVGNLEVQTEASAGFKTMTLKGAPGADVAMTVLYGAKITKLAELRRMHKIAFHSNRDGNYEIYTMNSDGSGQTRITNNSAADLDPSWSPDGSRIAFYSQRDGNNEIYTVGRDGSSQTRLTNNTATDYAPCWSPDGTKIAFTSMRDGNEEIYSMNADGSGQTRLTNNSTGDSNPCWSPDNAKIAFGSYRDGNYEIYTMYANGSGQTRLTNNSAADASPSWSPDGSKICFHSARDGVWEIYTMNASGSSQTRITDNTPEDSFASWSPDGARIAFEGYRDGNYEIYTMDADGSGQTRLTSASGDSERPDWCPALSSPEVYRTLIGSSGSDLGSTPPFGTYRYMAVVGLSRAGMVAAATLAMPGSASAVTPEALDYGGSSLVGLKLTGSPVYGVMEDAGRGKPALFWDTDTTSQSAGALLVFFDGDTGRVVSIIASTDTASTAAASASPAAHTSGRQIVLTGSFAAAYDAEDRDGNRVSGTASKIVLEESTGRIISVE